MIYFVFYHSFVFVNIGITHSHTYVAYLKVPRSWNVQCYYSKQLPLQVDTKIKLERFGGL